jgi:hypothetical protein
MNRASLGRHRRWPGSGRHDRGEDFRVFSDMGRDKSQKKITWIRLLNSIPQAY